MMKRFAEIKKRNSKSEKRTIPVSIKQMNFDGGLNIESLDLLGHQTRELLSQQSRPKINTMKMKKYSRQPRQSSCDSAESRNSDFQNSSISGIDGIKINADNSMKVFDTAEEILKQNTLFDEKITNNFMGKSKVHSKFKMNSNTNHHPVTPLELMISKAPD